MRDERRTAAGPHHVYVEHAPMKDLADGLGYSVRHAQRQPDDLKKRMQQALKALVES